MTRWPKRSGLVIVAVTTSPGLARAEPCEGPTPETGVPVRVPWDPAALGTLPEACPANALTLTSWGRILIAEEDYYGQLYAGAAVRARWRAGGGLWFSATAPGVEYRYVANATVDRWAQEMSAGSFAIHATIPSGREVAVAPFFRVLIPTETAYHNATRWGFEHGLSATWRAVRSLEIVGGWQFPALIVDSGGRAYAFQLAGTSADAIGTPWPWLSVGAGMGIGLRAGDSPGFEGFVPRATLRFYPWRGAVVALAAGFPMAGEDRTDAALGATLGWVL